MPFSILKSRRLFSGRVFDLVKEKWLGPDNRIFQKHTILHPGAVAIVPFSGLHSIFMIKQHRPAVRKEILEIPAGTLEQGERPLACAKRELREEIGRSARKWKRLGAVFTAPGFCSEKITLYCASGLRPARAKQDEDEYIEVIEMSKRAVKKAVREGRICDAKTLSALLLLEWLT